MWLKNQRSYDILSFYSIFFKRGRLYEDVTLLLCYFNDVMEPNERSTPVVYYSVKWWKRNTLSTQQTVSPKVTNTPKRSRTARLNKKIFFQIFPELLPTF